MSAATQSDRNEGTYDIQNTDEFDSLVSGPTS